MENQKKSNARQTQNAYQLTHIIFVSRRKIRKIGFVSISQSSPWNLKK